MPRRLTVPAPAKVNLILEIQGRRPDGYHELKTVMHALELADTLCFTENRSGLRLVCNHPQVPVDGSNLIHRAAVRLAQAAGIVPKVTIRLTKRIPVAAGLGGGSSDAAAALLGLARWWRLGRQAPLRRIASELGSDVPFFLSGGCALGQGRGERLTPWPSAPGMWVVLVNPGFPVSTAEVYRNFRLQLTRKKACITMMRSALKQKNAEKISRKLFNHLEWVTAAKHPLIARIKQELIAGGALGALMSGSGPTVFGLAPDQRTARQLQRRLRAKYPVCLVTRTAGSPTEG
ncbi:MAG: 4-(cytidine 5'-diphospho)-2-C-methyl-D-erythritol kinase [candidate division FCPU426 bacterium]